MDDGHLLAIDFDLLVEIVQMGQINPLQFDSLLVAPSLASKQQKGEYGAIQVASHL